MPQVISLDTIWLFPEFTTPEKFTAATGKPCPDFDPLRPIKLWFDNTIEADYEGSAIQYTVVAQDWSNMTPRTKDGKPYFTQLVLDSVTAASVNIPKNEPSNRQGDKHMPNPIDLTKWKPEYQLTLGFGGTVQIAVAGSETPADYIAELRNTLDKLEQSLPKS